MALTCGHPHACPMAELSTVPMPFGAPLLPFPPSVCMARHLNRLTMMPHSLGLWEQRTRSKGRRPHKLHGLGCGL